eukprot:364873-Chlamydomonas_euryale.AAC.5
MCVRFFKLCGGEKEGGCGAGLEELHFEGWTEQEGVGGHVCGVWEGVEGRGGWRVWAWGWVGRKRVLMTGSGRREPSPMHSSPLRIGRSEVPVVCAPLWYGIDNLCLPVRHTKTLNPNLKTLP